MRFDFAKLRQRLALTAGAGLAGLLLAAPAARAEIVGQLVCNIAPGQGAGLITSTRAVSCTFRSNGVPDQLYNGTFNRVGIDIGTLNSGTLTYSVLQLGTPGPGDLQGTYLGGGGTVVLGNGIGIETLIGGLGRGITLQPIATTMGTGTNISAGLGSLQLQFAGLVLPPRMARHHRRRIVLSRAY